MKLLFVDFTLPYLLSDADHPVGGWAVQLSSWLRALSNAGHAAGVLTHIPGDVRSNFGFDLLETYDPSKGVRILKYAYSYIPSLLSVSRRYRPDVIIQACAGLQTGIMAFVAHRIGVPFVYRVSSDMDVDGRYRAHLSRSEQIGFRYGLTRASTVICQSQQQLENLHAFLPLKRATAIGNPIYVPENVAKLRARSERRYVAWVGLFRREKNMKRLLQIARSFPEVEFRIAGQPAGTLDRDTSIAVEHLSALENVIFVGYVKRSEVFNFLSSALALLCTSDFEGISNTFLEAFVVGTPVITRRGVDPDQIVANRNLGWVAGNDADFPAAVRGMLSLPDPAYMEMAARCRSYVESSHSPPLRVQQLIEALTPSCLRVAS